jgi:hypothetical protein
MCRKRKERPSVDSLFTTISNMLVPEHILKDFDINGKIQRFVSANYGTKDKDFFMYRIKGYFS